MLALFVGHRLLVEINQQHVFHSVSLQRLIDTEPGAVATGCFHFNLSAASGRYRSRFCIKRLPTVNRTASARIDTPPENFYYRKCVRSLTVRESHPRKYSVIRHRETLG